MLDSEADFKARALEIGVESDELNNLVRLSFNTFGKLAFACNYIPGQADDRPVRELAADVCGVSPAPAGRVAVIRRLVFDAYTLAAADVKLRTERNHDDAPRKLAQAERSARYTEQAKRLSGINMIGE